MDARDAIRLDRIEDDAQGRDYTAAERRELAAIYEREEEAEDGRRRGVDWFEVV